MFKRLVACLLALFMLSALLAGCHNSVPETVTEPTVAQYKVTFAMRGHILSEQMVPEGCTPAAVGHEVEGLVFSGWQDAQGQPVDPFTQTVTGEVRYEALAYPDISNHTPFLQIDEQGFLRPDDALTMDDLYFALHSLAVSGAESYFPGLYTGQAKVSLQELTKVLEHFFPADAVAAVFTEDPTRTAFAQGMLALLNRSAEDIQLMDAETVLPLDLHAGRTDNAALLESCIAHTPDETGNSWADLELPTAYEPGFVNIDGWLYYVKEDGYFLKDDKVGALYFGEDGRYTSGDAQLDQMVTERLAKFFEENPEKTRFEILRVAYDHCVADYHYLRKEAYGKGAMGWEIEDAKKMFESTYGNCYGFAAIFWALARGLGYEAYVISGTCTGSDQPHGWVIIEIDGADYFFDPEWHYAYINENRPVKDMFMISMEDAWYWSYKWDLY